MLLFPREIMLFTLVTVCEGIWVALHSSISQNLVCAKEMTMEGEDSRQHWSDLSINPSSDISTTVYSSLCWAGNQYLGWQLSLYSSRSNVNTDTDLDQTSLYSPPCSLHVPSSPPKSNATAFFILYKPVQVFFWQVRVLCPNNTQTKMKGEGFVMLLCAHGSVA